MEPLRYPIGRFQYEGMSSALREQWIAEIESQPQRLKELTQGLSDDQLDTPYRGGGWTVRQIIHHIADSSMNCFTRFKLALTEDNPTIKPFNDKWAMTADSLGAAPGPSLLMLEGIHIRWILLLRSMKHAEFERQFYHPELGKQLKLSYFLGYVAWHGNHHIAHISSLMERKEW
ncbi:YfiT family bacillithiol transferase [Paenibacillus sp. HB172176]|uniref:YfiT family bacillithiol transferase n=1 Tax=Paenibacillus sp. HB172176 TaxID=2493690 RepID=UPI00143B9F2C|nr:putative metal-dependent hydrolase [Paenibacillus sp. HB172176]